MKNSKFIGYSVGASALLLPVLAFAQTGGSLVNLENLADSFARIVNTMLPVAFTLAILFFFWGVAKYILNAGDEEKAKQGKQIMIWGAIALAVISSVWGIAAFLRSTFGINTNSAYVAVPGVKGVNVIAP